MLKIRLVGFIILIFFVLNSSDITFLVAKDIEEEVVNIYFYNTLTKEKVI